MAYYGLSLQLIMAHSSFPAPDIDSFIRSRVHFLARFAIILSHFAY